MNIKAIILITLLSAQVLTACGGTVFSATSVPVVMPTSTIDPLASAKIVQAFWDALEVGDLDTAMAYIHENASCAGYCYFTGKSAFESYLKGYLEAGHVTQISDVKSVGNIVTYSWSVYRNGNFISSGESD